MNYYQFNIGDYIGHTAHLDPIEDIAYRRLLDLYYQSESPIPNETQMVSKRIRMGSHHDAVEAVLREFFILGDDGMWHQPRCDKEIEAYQAKASRNREVGKLGGRPKKTAQVDSGNPEKTQMVNFGNPEETLTKKQETITKKQEKNPPTPQGGVSDSVSASGQSETPKPAKKQPKAGSDNDTLFTRFWSEYPRKTAKENARKAWARLSPDEALLDLMLAALAAQCRQPEWLKEGGQFIPHPATWLNGRRWEDQRGISGHTRHGGFAGHNYESEQGSMFHE